MANETILVVDGDTQSRKVLEVSFKKSGYRVLMTESAAEALACIEDETPDLIVSDTDLPDGDGFGFCKEVKSRSEWEHIPFLFLTEESSLPQKIEGLEIGADDYLTRPIYIKEVTTRVEVLLQKRDRELLSEGGLEEFTGELSDITLIDLLQTIDEESRTGLVEFERDDSRGTMTFEDGRVIDARCGKLQGEAAVYRLMLWPSGKFVVKYRDEMPGAVHIDKSTQELLLEGIQRLQQWDRLTEELPSLERIFETDYHALPELLDEVPEDVGRIVRLFDGFRTLREVIDDSPVDDVTSLRIIRRIFDEGVLEDVTGETDRESRSEAESHLADWLEQEEARQDDRVEEGSEEQADRGEPAEEESEQRELEEDEEEPSEDTSPGYPGVGPEHSDPSETQEINHDDLATALSRELENEDSDLVDEKEVDDEFDPESESIDSGEKLEGNDRTLTMDSSATDSEAEEPSSGESSGPRYMPDAKPAGDEQRPVEREAREVGAAVEQEDTPSSVGETLSELAEAERLRRQEEAKRLVEQQSEGEASESERPAADGGGERSLEPEDTEQEIDSDELRRIQEEGVPRIPGATQTPTSGEDDESDGDVGGAPEREAENEEVAPADQTNSGEWQSSFGEEEEGGEQPSAQSTRTRTDTPGARPTADKTAPWSGDSDEEDAEGGRLEREDLNSGVPVSFQTVEGDGEKDAELADDGGQEQHESPGDEADVAREKASEAIRESAQQALDEAASAAGEAGDAPSDLEPDGEMADVERVSTDGQMVREEYDLSKHSSEGPDDEGAEGREARERADASGSEDVVPEADETTDKDTRERSSTSQGQGVGGEPGVGDVTSGAEEVLLDEGLEWDDEPSARPGEPPSPETGGQSDGVSNEDDEDSEALDSEGSDGESGGEAGDRSFGETADSEELDEMPHEKVEEASDSATDEWPGSRVEAAGPQSDEPGDEVDETSSDDTAEPEEAPSSQTDDGLSARFTDTDEETEDEEAASEQTSAEAEALSDNSKEASFFEEEPEEEYEEELDWDFDDEVDQTGGGAWRYVAGIALFAAVGVGAAWAGQIGPFSAGSAGSENDGEDSVASSETPDEETGESGEADSSSDQADSDGEGVPEPEALGEQELKVFAEKTGSSITDDVRKTTLILAGKDPALTDEKDEGEQGDDGGDSEAASADDDQGEQAPSDDEQTEVASSSSGNDDQGGGGTGGSPPSTESASSGASGSDSSGGSGGQVGGGIAEVERMLGNRDYSGARSRLQELKRQAPNDPDVAGLYLDLASNLQIDGQVDQAKRAYQQYLDMRPNGSRASEVRSILDRL